MNLKKNFLNLFLGVLVSGANAQDFNNYQTLSAKGKIPKDYITSSTVKYKNEISKIEQVAQTRKERKTRTAFALESNFTLDDMLQSGLVIFNDDVTTYLNQVMAQLTAVYNMKVPVYTLRTTAVNAFATPRGDIFVTLGLLAQLEDEAQLAFILAHELTHVKKEHSIELYLTAAGLGKSSKTNEIMRKSSFDDYLKYVSETKSKGLKLGIPKVVIVNPFYLKLDIRSGTDIQYIATEEGQEHQRNLIEQTAKATNLNTTILDVTHLNESQIDAFNDIRFLNEYFAEQNKFSGLSLTPSSQQNRIDSIAKKYGTDYFLWTGTVSIRETRNPHIAQMIYLWPALPFVLLKHFETGHQMFHYAVLYDVRTGRNQVIKSGFFDNKDSDGLMKSQLYDTFLQIKVGDDDKPAKPAPKKQKAAAPEEEKSSDAKEEVKEKEKVEEEKVEKAVEKEAEKPQYMTKKVEREWERG